MKSFMDHIEMLSLLNVGYRPIDVAYNKYVRFVDQCEQGNIPSVASMIKSLKSYIE
jgi:hypothetical protein